MKKVLVLGYGNPLRGDDGVGPAVALDLQEKLEKLFTTEAQRTRRRHRVGVENVGGNAQYEPDARELSHPAELGTVSSIPPPCSSSNLLCAPSAFSVSLWLKAFSGVSLRCKALHQLTPELAPDVAESDLVIFIDASCDNEPGEVASRRVVPECSPSNTSFSHQLTPEVLLAFAERLYGTCPEAVLLSVGAASFEYGEGLSDEVQAAVPVLLDRVQAACAVLHS